MRLSTALFAAVLVLNLVATAMMVRELSRIVAPIEKVAALPRPLPKIHEDVAAFQASPAVNTWQNVDDDIVLGQLQLDSVKRITTVLASHDLPPQLTNAVVVDLSSYDMMNTIRWLHETNLIAQANSTPDSSGTIRRTAHLCWLLLALRPPYGTAGIDLTHMDLRSNEQFVGQRMNLSYIDFTNALLPAGVWNESNLVGSAFVRTHTAGPLTCSRCSFAASRSVPMAHLSEGTWIASDGTRL